MYKNDDMIIFYHKKTFDVLTILVMNDTQIDIKDFIDSRLKYDDKFTHLLFDDVGVTSISQKEYNNVISNTETDIKWFVNPITEKYEYDVCKRDYESVRNKTFIGNEYDRTYSEEQVYYMYNEDYINVNLKNIIKSGVLKAEFISIKDLKIRPRISHRAWKYFDKDPYLRDIYDDKLKLGKSIVEIGTYYPFIVAPMTQDDDSLYVFEGNHRIMSLKLLSMEGVLDDNFKVLCLILPTDFYTFQQTYQYKQLSSPVQYRYVMDDIYGLDIFKNDDLMQKTLNQIKSNNEVLLDNYTVESVATHVYQIFRSIHTYPLFLRDLIYCHNNKILPSPVINDENEFKEWINS